MSRWSCWVVDVLGLAWRILHLYRTILVFRSSPVLSLGKYPFLTISLLFPILVYSCMLKNEPHIAYLFPSSRNMGLSVTYFIARSTGRTNPRPRQPALSTLLV